MAFRAEFRDWYLLPMIGCIWSMPGEHMLRFPVGRAGPLLPQPRPAAGHATGRSGAQWPGGSREYVRRIVERIADKRLNTPVLAHRNATRAARP